MKRRCRARLKVARQSVKLSAVHQPVRSVTRRTPFLRVSNLMHKNDNNDGSPNVAPHLEDLALLTFSARFLMVIVMLFSAASASASPDDKLPTPAEVMFDRAHLDGTKAGDMLTYKVKRDVSEPKLLGPSFEDTIKVEIKSVDENNAKALTVNVFTGDRARDPRNITGMTGNPVLVFFLDRSVFGYASVAGGKRAYLKNRFRIELRDTAKIKPAKVAYGGQTYDGYRVRVQPYAVDGNKNKMRGYADSIFELVLSEKIPGHFAQFKIDIKSIEKGRPSFVETISLDGAEVVE